MHTRMPRAHACLSHTHVHVCVPQVIADPILVANVQPCMHMFMYMCMYMLGKSLVTEKLLNQLCMYMYQILLHVHAQR